MKNAVPQSAPRRKPSPHQTATIERLARVGIRAETIAAAIDLMRTDQVDVIEDVIAGRLPVERACCIARQRVGRS
jgi:hypothetical protein